MRNCKLRDDFRFSQPGVHPLQPFGDMSWTNGILQCLHIIGQHQQHGARAVEGEVKDGRVNCLVIIDIKSLLFIHHLDRNLDNDNFNMKSLDWKRPTS